MTEILDLLWTFTSVQQRMILHDSLVTRQVGQEVSSLQKLSRDAVMLSLVTNNSQERRVKPLVNRLKGEITVPARKMLLASYSGESNICFNEFCPHYQYYVTGVEDEEDDGEYVGEEEIDGKKEVMGE